MNLSLNRQLYILGSNLISNGTFGLKQKKSEHYIIKRNKNTNKQKLSDLIPGYEVNPARYSHDPNKVILIFLHIFWQKTKKAYSVKGLGFSIPPKEIECVDFLAQFELLYWDIMFEMKSENRDFLKDKLKDICFSTLKSYSLDKVEKKKILEAEYIALKNLIERKDPDIQKADIGTQELLQIALNI